MRRMTVLMSAAAAMLLSVVALVYCFHEGRRVPPSPPEPSVLGARDLSEEKEKLPPSEVEAQELEDVLPPHIDEEDEDSMAFVANYAIALEQSRALFRDGKGIRNLTPLEEPIFEYMTRGETERGEIIQALLEAEHPGEQFVLSSVVTSSCCSTVTESTADASSALLDTYLRTTNPLVKMNLVTWIGNTGDADSTFFAVDHYLFDNSNEAIGVEPALRSLEKLLAMEASRRQILTDYPNAGAVELADSRQQARTTIQRLVIARQMTANERELCEQIVEKCSGSSSTGD